MGRKDVTAAKAHSRGGALSDHFTDGGAVVAGNGYGPLI